MEVFNYLYLRCLRMSEIRGATDGVTIQQNSSLSQAIIEAVAEEEAVDPLKLDPLYDVIDPDALDDLFQSESICRVLFEYNGYEVEVTAGGNVTLRTATA